LLVNRFVIPFELTALLLLAAIVGAVIIAKKRL
jgi:NADH:ubiquinone oxidoreductase subunit 6 (subunit J)